MGLASPGGPARDAALRWARAGMERAVLRRQPPLRRAHDWPDQRGAAEWPPAAVEPLRGHGHALDLRRQRTARLPSPDSRLFVARRTGAGLALAHPAWRARGWRNRTAARFGCAVGAGGCGGGRAGSGRTCAVLADQPGVPDLAIALPLDAVVCKASWFWPKHDVHRTGREHRSGNTGRRRSRHAFRHGNRAAGVVGGVPCPTASRGFAWRCLAF